MQMIKKFSVAMIALIMAFSLVATSGIAATSFNDVPDSSPYKEAISTLAFLGLLAGYEDGTFQPDNTITRGELAAVMTRALALEQVAKIASSVNVFNDMIGSNGAEHWASGYVKVAYDRDIISGYGDGTFGPDHPITYEQVVKLIVCTLGYGIEAEAKGGWPNGYLIVGNDKGVTKNANMTPTNQPVPRGMVAKLIYNSLEINMMEKNTLGEWFATRKTILSDKLKVSKLTNAMVTDVDGVSSLNAGTSSVKVGEVMLEVSKNAAKYTYTSVSNSADMMARLGQYVTCYYKYDEDTEIRTLLSLTANTRNTPITVLSGNIIDYNANTKVLQYWTDKEKDIKGKDMKISDDMKLVYNGRAYDYKSANVADKMNLSYWLSPQKGTFFNGEIRLMDSGNDDVVSVIFMTDYKTYVVKSAVVTDDPSYLNNYIIYDYYVSGKSIQMDPMDDSIVVNITNVKTGKPMELAYLQPMNVVSIAESGDSQLYNCYVSTDTVTGTINSIGSNDEFYIIGNKEYEITPELRAALASGKESMALDSSGTFYLDMYGRIAAVKITEEKAGNYAYLTETNSISDKDANAMVRLFMPSSNTVNNLQLAGRVKINGTYISDSIQKLETLEGAASLLKSNMSASQATHSQLIKYTTNSSGYIDNIYTATTKNGALDIGTLGTTSSVALKLGMQETTLTYSRTNNFENKILTDANTVVIVVPKSRGESNSYRKYTAASLFKVGNSYDIEAYDVNNEGLAKVVVVYGEAAEAAIDADTPVSIINKMTQVSSQFGTGIVWSIEAYENGSLVTHETADLDSFSSLSIGDVVRFGYNNYNQINEVSYVQHANNLTAGKVQETAYDGGYRFITLSGTVTSVAGDILSVAPAFVNASGGLEVSERETWPYIPGKTKVYTVSQQGSSKQVTVNSNGINSLYEYADGANPNASKVTLYMYKNELTAIIIYSGQ